MSVAMAEPENLIIRLLRELRAEMDARFEAVEKRFDTLEGRMDARFEAIDRRLDIMHRNGEKALRGFIGHRTMVERTMASFEDEISALKRRVEVLEDARA
jgi:hypothetical protein